jgi:hypothetical protein
VAVWCLTFWALVLRGLIAREAVRLSNLDMINEADMLEVLLWGMGVEL